jgi:hypothetical protein
MLQCVQDLIVHIQQDWQQYGVLISQDVTFYPAVDETTDKATGIVARFVLRIRQVNCVIPEAPTTIIVQPNQSTYATLLTCETLVDCPVFRQYAYTGGTYSGGTLTLTSLGGETLEVTGFPTPILESPVSPQPILYLWSGTQAEYNALTPDPTTIYFIV